jgi:predicted regulator of Ras-like GTPase activity (Roadblock/LC7/MglB family)
MVEYLALEQVLDEVRSIPSVYEATVVSRSGMHIAGDAPKGVHLETFVAMSAILLGAAETATAGPRALLVVTASKDMPTSDLTSKMKDFASKVDEKI